uniref:non-specific serine/threonine protein kinase n=2 Tax=Odontella aurita TaxID=265563 RepID=A0A6U6IAM5_9STRA|mmetsp:Transcript_49382/g.148744  ORF Transcript_49382/g.148744 Transcript_49382/m.148744 type:complete len:514 (+) Transcript_49382:367-1908(+)
MGGSTSREASAAADKGGGGEQTTMMQRYDSEEEDCRCSAPLFSACAGGGGKGGGGKRRGKRSAYDPIGSPISTPVDVRRRKAEAIREANAARSARAAGGTSTSTNGRVARGERDDPFMGLEKEPGSERHLGSNSGGTGGGDPDENDFGWTRQPSAVVHEGKDSERDLYREYELCEVLGVGSTSTCHRCVHRPTGQSRACKVIDKRHIESRFAGMIEQFHTEIQALRSLHHPNIITLYDVYITDEKIFIVMELMEGGELFDYVVQKGTLNEEEASKIVRKVTGALVYMHSKNIIHRDMKPENLLLTHKPRSMHDIEVKIIDFGLSKCMEEPVARSFLGTRGYLAPEMLQRRDYSRSVDAWALGVIVFVLLCGCLPFDDDSVTVPSDEMVRAKFVLRFPRWARNLSPSAKNLLSHLLDVNPVTRYSAEQALNHPWVRGETAPKDSLLQSPGRIKLTPGKGKVGGAGGVGGVSVSTKDHIARVRADRAKSPVASGGRPRGGAHHTPKRQLVRKTSI